MNLRPYQLRALDAAQSSLQAHRAALIVLPTGTGKTVVFSHLARQQRKRTLVLAHRQELIEQAAQKLKDVTGEHASIEMADRYSNETCAFGPSRYVVASVQTMLSGHGGRKRMHRFNPSDFSLVIVDEAHHASARSYREIMQYFLRWPTVSVLGVTATPDRGDRKTLGSAFQTIAYSYDVLDAINDGWLVPIRQSIVQVGALDFSDVRVRGGDFVESDLARVMNYEKVLHGVVAPAHEITAGKQTLVFAASVDHATRMAEMWNRYEPGCAQSIDGSMAKDKRRTLLSAFANRQFRVLTSCMVLTEGWDCPQVEAIVMARPTKSRALYAQMLGRGTRPLPGLVDACADADARIAAIASSAKSEVAVVDFSGNATKHKLVCSLNVLRPELSDEICAMARERMKKGVRPEQAAQDAEEELEKKREAARREQEARRAAIRAKAEYQVRTVDPFCATGVARVDSAFDRGRELSEGMLRVLVKGGVNPSGLGYGAAKKIVADIVRRWKGNCCSLKQAHYLHQMGYTPEQTREMPRLRATEILDSAWGKR